MSMWYLLVVLLSVFEICSSSQRDPICDLISATNVANITDYLNWECNSTGFPVTNSCTWNGTVCHNDLITELSLISIGLDGTLPPSLGSMASLENILISSNFLYGSIPTSITCLSNLVFLDLFANDLSGTLPSEINLMSGLTRLDLSFNKISGTIPSIQNMSSMVRFQIGENLLNGKLPDFSHNLEMFLIILNANYLTGTLPAGLVQLASTLEYIYVDENYLTGVIPSSYGAMTMLYFLDLGTNSFSGTLPSSMSEMINLRFFKIPENFGISGAIPTTLGLLSRIENLSLEYTNLAGTIPSQLCDLQQDLTINVASTQIHCYGGCLTSENVNIIGASTVCPDGSILRRFLIIGGVLVGICVAGTAYYRFKVVATGAPTGNPTTPAETGTVATADTKEEDYNDPAGVGSRSVLTRTWRNIRAGFQYIHSCLFRNTLAIAFYKVAILLFISLFVERYWLFCALGFSPSPRPTRQLRAVHRRIWARVERTATIPARCRRLSLLYLTMFTALRLLTVSTVYCCVV